MPFENRDNDALISLKRSIFTFAMNDIFIKNMSYIENRWPDCATFLESAQGCNKLEHLSSSHAPSLRADGYLLASIYDRESEAQLQASLVPQESKVAWVYGPGLGDIPRALVNRPQIEKLYVVVMAPWLFFQILQHFDQTDWLSDSRVELTIAERTHPSYPFAACPPELILAAREAHVLRDRILLELATPYINGMHSDKDGQIADRIESNEPFVARDGDVAELFEKWQGKEVYVVAAGPTLENTISLLQHKEDRLIIAVDGAMPALISAGVVPDAVVTIDDQPTIAGFFRGIEADLFKNSIMVYFPRVHSDVLSIWPGRRLVAYSAHSNYLRINEKYPREILHSSGSVIHPAIDLAVRAGASRVVLFGADFSFPGNKVRANDRAIETSRMKSSVQDGHGNMVPTQSNMLGYLRDLESYIQLNSDIDFVNSCRDGAFIAGTEYLEGV